MKKLVLAAVLGLMISTHAHAAQAPIAEALTADCLNGIEQVRTSSTNANEQAFLEDLQTMLSSYVNLTSSDLKENELAANETWQQALDDVKRIKEYGSRKDLSVIELSCGLK